MPRPPRSPTPPRSRTSGRGTSFLLAAIVTGNAPLAVLAAGPGGCHNFTATDAALLEGADVAACAGLSLIPVVGGFLGAACVGEEPAVKAALDHAVTPDASLPIAPQPTPLSAASAGVRLGAPLYATRGGRRAEVGRAPAAFSPAMVRAAQAHLDAQGTR